MAVRIMFLGPLADMAGEPSRDVPGPLDWSGLLAIVGKDVAAQLENARIHVACAGKVLPDRSSLYANDGDEVALLPPVSGG